jgi:hypothetical protein
VNQASTLFGLEQTTGQFDRRNPLLGDPKCRAARPHQIATAKIRALGMEFGGAALWESISRLGGTRRLLSSPSFSDFRVYSIPCAIFPARRTL